MLKPHLLIVDDEPLVLKSLEQLLMDDYSLMPVSSGAEAVTAIQNGGGFDAIILDIKMAKMDGLATADQIRKVNPSLPIIFYTGYPGDYSEQLIDREYQPFDFIIKNERPTRLLRSIKNAVAWYRLKNSSTDLVKLAREEYGMIGRSRAMREVYQTIEKIAPTDAKVMILGQTGTGKELVARAIHKRSQRANKRFAILNCNHKQPDLVASELFGHLRGSFTGAVADRLGLFEYADGGTVFLDEIGDLDLNTQARLLRVLESGEMQKIGSPEILSVNVRLICATHHDLKDMARTGGFREDLYFRLKGVSIHLPPLAERREDIPDLIDYFTHEYSRRADAPLKVFDPMARSFLIDCDWPGNVRQLLEVIQSLMDLSASSYITRDDASRFLETATESAPEHDSFAAQLRSAKKTIVIKALSENDHNISAAARELGLDRSNLYKMIKELGIVVGDATTKF